MSLDSRKSGFARLNTSSTNQVYTITAHPGLATATTTTTTTTSRQPNTSNLDSQQQQSSSSTTTNANNSNTTTSANNSVADQEVEITYTDLRTIGNGSFGVVFQATLQKPTHEQVAIKKVLQDKRFKNRELQIMRKLDHCNVVKLKYFFHTVGDRGSSEVYLHLVLEYIPETLYKIARTHSRTRQNLPMLLVKLYMYQLFRSLNYIHSMDICHRDIKPQNLLLNPETGVLKLCDFGSAKSLVGGEPNVAYICSRYYRAPELIFGATDYTTKIDIWSAGCVMAELILGEPMFPGESGVDQLVEIIKVLGTPTREQMKAMNPNYTEFRFPVIRARSWNRVFSTHTRTPPEAAKLVSNLLEYTPSNRLTPLAACAHPFFDELRSSNTKLLPNGREFPPLFNFSDEELRKEPHLAVRLRPAQHHQQSSDPQQQHHRNTGTSSSSSSATTTTTSASATTATNINNTSSKLNTIDVVESSKMTAQMSNVTSSSENSSNYPNTNTNNNHSNQNDGSSGSGGGGNTTVSGGPGVGPTGSSSSASSTTTASNQSGGSAIRGPTGNDVLNEPPSSTNTAQHQQHQPSSSSSQEPR